MFIARLVSRGKRSTVELDTGETLVVVQDVALKYFLYQGKSIDDTEWQAIVEEQNYVDALVAAHRFVGYRARSVLEVERKLRGKGFGTPIVARVVERLRSTGVLDDGDFSGKFVHDALLKKPVGRLRLRRELKAKGLDDAMIDRALDAQFDTARETDAARSLAERRGRTMRGGTQTERRFALASYLRSRGFSREAIDIVVAECSAKWSDEENP